ncbi:hypothetical protein CPB84DRAFT_1449294 [Gymnopilus junonius]|uniref:Uncharacterized protein n=1 Tax=Gymnopilus junonius TaxID=109634 RepID=A0A9P5NHY0_GYMJU|nr:hypothetical protein CPB84DRAFT_1449294 [Gymnopilus junonius]
MAHFSSLAPELVDYIVEYSEIQAIKSLRLTCKFLDDRLASKVLQTLSFDMDRYDFESQMDMIRSLATMSSDAASRTTRNLVVKSLSPKHDNNTTQVYHTVGQELVRYPPAPFEQKIYKAEKELKLILFDALTSLKNVKSARWETTSSDEEWAQTIVLNALLSYANLTSLHISLTHARIAIPFHLFSNLEKIILDEHLSPDKKSIGQDSVVNLAKLVAQLPPGQISSLTVHREWHMTRSTKALSLHDLFQFMDEATPLHLQRLEISGSFVRLDSVTVPHLRHLTSLHINNAFEPSREPVVKGARGTFVRCGTVADDVLEKQRAVGSSLNQFWTDLSRESIHLEEIVLNNVVPGFMQYLTTYSGLKRLKLSAVFFTTTAGSEASAQMFFSNPFKLESHSDSLENLSINVTYEGLWCFGRHCVDSISQLKLLRKLEIAIAGDDLGQLEESEPDFINQQANAIILLLDTVTLQLPRMRHLTINSAVPESHRGSKIGTRSYMYMRSVKTKIIDSIGQYKAPLACTHLPSIGVSGTVYHPKSDYIGENGSVVWGYHVA